MNRSTRLTDRCHYRRLALLLGLLTAASCGASSGTPGSPSPAAGDGVTNDGSLFALVFQADPFSGYTLFPNVEEFSEGRLNGSEAHQPTVRVTMNARAFGALQNGRLPAASQFPDGSVIFKEIKPRADAAATTYAVMYKDSGNALAADGWVWAEFGPGGVVQYSVANRGNACTSCHQREQGPQNDLVRTFERQR